MLLIFKNYKSKEIRWFIVMLVGFIISAFGLALYTTYIFDALKTGNPLFASIEMLIWKLNYYLNFDILDQYRIMNIGTAIYIYGTICFSVETIRKGQTKRFLLLSILPIIIVVFYDPLTLNFIYKTKNYNFYANNTYAFDAIMKNVNLFFNLAIKGYLIASIVIMAKAFLNTPKAIQKKYQYMIIGIIPICMLFFVLFFKFPNHNVIFRRYEQLLIYSLTFNKVLYHIVMFLCFVSMITLVYAMFKYNVFEINLRKNKIEFDNEVRIANFGSRVFTHSIKNQFIAIKLLAQQYERTEDKESYNKINQNILNICDESMEKLSVLSKNFGSISLEYSNVNLKQVLVDVVSKLKQRYKSVEFVTTYDDDLKLFVDGEQLIRVLDNVIINGIEACETDKNPQLVIETYQFNDFGVISIEDNGKGIEPKNLKKVFKPFYSTKPMASNWGVGLAFCQKVIDAFGGFIYLESALNEGTRIEIYIPAVRRGKHGENYMHGC